MTQELIANMLATGSGLQFGSSVRQRTARHGEPRHDEHYALLAN